MSADPAASDSGRGPGRAANAAGDEAKDEALVGTVIDKRYRLTGLIGRGGMGRVFRAEHVTMRKVFAVKLLSPRTADPRERARFDREAFATGRTAHPNCVMASDCGTLEDGTRYLAMELLEGDTLAELLDREGKLSVERTLRIGKHILRGVGHAHGLGVVHRDLKPRNIMLVSHLDDPEFAKVLDFGLAKLLGEVQEEEGGGDLTEVGITFGTPAYMSPEQASGRPVDARADLYAVAVLMFEMLAGRPPFCGADPQATLMMHVRDTPPRVKEVAPDAEVPTDVELMLRRSLDKHPDQRFADADAFIAEIERCEKAASGDEEIPADVRAGDEAHAVALSEGAAAKNAPAAQEARAPVAWPPRKEYVIGVAIGAALLVAVIAVIAGRGSSSNADDPPQASATGTDVDDQLRARVPDLDRAASLLRDGKKQKAAQLLDELRRRHPKNALVAYTQGQMYMRWPWPVKAMQAYGVAIRLDPTYRTNRVLIQNAVRTLLSPSGHRDAARLLVEDLDTAARPALTRAAREHKNPLVRRRAANALRRIDEISP